MEIFVLILKILDQGLEFLGMSRGKRQALQDNFESWRKKGNDDAKKSVDMKDELTRLRDEDPWQKEEKQ